MSENYLTKKVPVKTSVPKINSSSDILKEQVLYCVGPLSANLGGKLHSNPIEIVSFEAGIKALEELWSKDAEQKITLIGDVSGLNDRAIELISKWKHLRKDHSIAIILLSDVENDAYKHNAIRFGADDYYYLGNLELQQLQHRINFIHSYNSLIKDYADDSPKPRNWQNKIHPVKRAIDVIVSLLLLIALLPIIAVIAIAIKIGSAGPVFYVSKRAGRDYHIFNFYKFRTMRLNADHQLDNLKDLNQYSGDNPEFLFFKLHNDPRVTKIGYLLRKTSLDELPQLLNVLKGDMSLVGNRPLPLYEAMQLTRDGWVGRFLAPAGMTGLWQITKRGKMDMSEEERVRLDLEYSNRNCLRFDFKILFKTLPAMLQEEAV